MYEYRWNWKIECYVSYIRYGNISLVFIYMWKIKCKFYRSRKENSGQWGMKGLELEGNRNKCYVQRYDLI